MQHILVAVDGSLVSRRALEMATDLARRYGARLTAVNVYTPLYVPPEPYTTATGDLETSLRSYAEDIAREAAGQAQSHGITADWVVATGAPADAVMDAATSRNVDLVVVGSRGRGAVKRVLLGSVSSRLSHICDKPLLIVH